MRNHRERLQDILDAIEQIEIEQAKGKSAFTTSRLIQVWMVHHFMIIGEAVRSIDPDFKRKNPSVPWKVISGMRNIIVHDYFRVNDEIVWNAIEEDIPALKREIQTLLNNESKK